MLGGGLRLGKDGLRSEGGQRFLAGWAKLRESVGQG